MNIFLTATPSSPLFQVFFADQRAPPCPFCQSEDTVVIGHNGIYGAITLCRCETCLEEWPETISDDDRE